MLLPNQVKSPQTAEEDLDEIKNPQEVTDEFAEVNKLTFKLFNVILEGNSSLGKFYKHPGDYEAFLKAIEEEDDYSTIHFDHNEQEDGSDNSNDDDDGNDSYHSTSSQASTMTPTTDSPQSSQSDWCLSTPNNSPVESIENTPVNPAELNSALRMMIKNLSKFNQEHPCPPPERRSTRQTMFRGSFNYNAKKRNRIQETRAEQRKGK